MAVSNSPFGSTDFSFMAQTALATSRQSAAEDRETLAENYSAKLDAFTASYNAALAEFEQAQAQALAAQQAAEAAAQAAAAQAAQAQADAAAAQASATAALEDALSAAEQAESVASEAASLAASLGTTAAPGAIEAQVEAERLRALAQQLIDDARNLVRQLAGMSIDLDISSELQARLDQLFAATESPFVEQAPSIVAQRRLTGPQELVVMPDVALETSTAMSADADDLAAVLAELERATVPPELEQQWQLAMAGLQQAIDFHAEGQSLFAQQARESWLPIATELMMEVDRPRAHADRNLTGDMAALLEATVTTDGAPPSDEEIAATLAELGFMPANAYFEGDPRVPPIGNGFFGVGDFGRTGQDSIYEWLPQMVALRASESTQGHYLLAPSDEVTTVEQHLRAVAEYEITHEGEITDDNGTHMGEVTEYLSYDAVIAELAARGLSAVEITAYLDTHERFMIAPAVVQSEGGDTPATYVARAQYLEAIGLPAAVPLDLQIAFNNSGSGEGDAWLDRTHADGSMGSIGYPQRAYHALVNDQLAADWVQIGDIGPLGDDIGKMLGEIYEKYGADTEEKREAIRNALFKYDERFGIMANREFIEAAVETNNNRRQGFFEGPVGRALLMVAASFLPGGQYISMALSAGFSLHDGASFGEALRGAAVSYFAAEFGNSVGQWVQTNFGSALTPEVARTLVGAANNLGATAFRQLVTSGRLDGDALLMAAASGGIGSYVTQFVGDSDFGRALDAQFGAGRTGEILGRLAAASADGRLTPEDFIGAFSAGRAGETRSQDGVTTTDGAGLQITRIDNDDGTYVFVRQGDEIYALNPDGSILRTYLGEDGQPVGAAYGDDGELVWQSNDLAAPSGGAGESGAPDPAEALRLAEERYATMLASGEATAEDLALARADIISAQLAAGVTIAPPPQRSPSFSSAFAEARASGAATFEWTDPRDGVTRVYTTMTADEVAAAQLQQSSGGSSSASGVSGGSGTSPAPVSRVPANYAGLPIWVNPNAPIVTSTDDGVAHGEFMTGGTTTDAASGVYMNLLPDNQNALVPNWIVQQFNELFGTNISANWTQFHLQAYVDNPIRYAMADGTMVIAAHGNRDGIGFYATGNYNDAHPLLGAAELAQLITSNPGYDPTTVIVLAACGTGVPGGVAEQLSMYLANPIVAPPDLTSSNPFTGAQTVDANPYARDHNFIVFQGGRAVGQTPVVYGRRPGG